MLYFMLVVATLLCTLVAGFVFAFATVVMPGIRSLSDGEFLKAFQVMDGVIQNRQPVFMVVWVGSVVALIAATVLGVRVWDGLERGLLIGALGLYLFGVQLPTAVINIPLNNKLQTLNIDSLTSAEREEARSSFESHWNRSNVARTILACAASALLLFLLLRV